MSAFLSKIQDKYGVTADSGDVEMYFNISEFFKSTMDTQMSHEQADLAMDMLRDALLKHRGQLALEARMEIKRDQLLMQKLKKAGLALKA